MQAVSTVATSTMVQATDTDTAPRSLCPISLALDVVGDKWSLLILRDLMFAGKSHYRELLQSDEGISSNILAERLKRLVEAGLLTKTDDPSHKQKAIYRLTAMGIDLLPAIAQLGIWGVFGLFGERLLRLGCLGCLGCLRAHHRRLSEAGDNESSRTERHHQRV